MSYCSFSDGIFNNSNSSSKLRPSLCENDRIDFLRIKLAQLLINRASLVNKKISWEEIAQLLDRLWVNSTSPCIKPSRLGLSNEIYFKMALRSPIVLISILPPRTSETDQATKGPKPSDFNPGKYIPPPKGLWNRLQYPLSALVRGSKIYRLTFLIPRKANSFKWKRRIYTGFVNFIGNNMPTLPPDWLKKKGR